MRKALLLSLVVVMVAAFAPAVFAQDAEPFKLTLMHTNDTHANHLPQRNGDGGVSRQATVVKQIRAEAANSLLLDAGDRFMGSLFHSTYFGQDQVRFMNALGYEAMALGNHEFDNGEDVLADFITGVNFPVLAANLELGNNSPLNGLVQPSTILEVGGRQIGIIGLVTADTPTQSSPSADTRFSDDYVGIANAVAAELEAQGVNIIILLTHTGIEVDTEMLAGLVGIDVVFGGHSHTLFSNVYRAAGDNTYPLKAVSSRNEETIVYGQTGQYNVYLGRMDLVFDENGVITDASGDTILLSRYITPDPEVEAIVTELRGPVDELANSPIGANATDLLVGDRSVCRVEECALGNLIADALRAETGAQIAFMNSGGIRANIEAGDISLGEVLTVQPFGNTTATFELTGADVLAALENGVSRLQVVDGTVTRQGANGRFLQVSGLRYSIDPTLEVGSRVVSVEVQAEDGSFVPLDPNATYTIAANNFIRVGGDGFSVFAENAINPYDFGRIDYEVTRDYLAKLGTVAPFIEGRITYVTAAPLPAQ